MVGGEARKQWGVSSSDRSLQRLWGRVIVRCCMPARTGGRRTLAVAEAISEVGSNYEDEERIKRIR